MDNYLTATEIKHKYRLSVASLYHWERQGVLHPVRTPGGHRRYSDKVDLVLVEYKDRLARFGFKYLEQFCISFGVSIIEIEKQPDKEPQAELVEDMISIVTRFSARIYGKRGGRVAKKLTALIAEEVAVSEDNC